MSMNRREFVTTTTLAALNCAVADRVLAQAQEKRWRVGVIGHTKRGDYGHGLHTMWLGVPETQIVGIADADSKGLESARKKVGDAPGFSDYRMMLAETKPEIVAVCPRHIDQHHEMILAAVEAGTRGIYVEKPFCRTPAEAEKALIAQFESLKTEGVTSHELQRAQNQFARDYILGRESDEDKALHLAHAAVIHNDITTADGEFDIFMKTTVADVQRVARSYFNQSNRVVLHVLPKGGAR